MENNTISEGFVLYKAKAGDATIVYIADREALGRYEEDSARGISLGVPEFLTRGTAVGMREILRELLESPVVVLYGERVIGIAVELGLVDPESVLEVNGLKHVQIFKFTY